MVLQQIQNNINFMENANGGARFAVKATKSLRI